MVNRIGLWTGIILTLVLTLCISFSGAEGSGSPVRASGDLDSDGKEEEYLLEGNRLIVKEAGEFLWQSPSDWKVDSFVLGDADNNGTVDLAVALWKTGSFGTVKPFWEKDEDTSYKNHLFVLKLEGNTFKSLWCSSDLDCPIVSLTIRDVNSDGLNELVVEEGQYRKVAGERYALDPDAPLRTTVWQWREWGFGAWSGK